MADPVGQVVRLPVRDYHQGARDEDFQIVGIVRNEQVEMDLKARMPDVAYVSLAQIPRPDVNLIVRTSGGPAGIMPAVRAAIRELDPRLALAGVRTMTQVRERSLSSASESTWVIGAFAAIAMVLAALGLYGVLAQDVTQRRREIGIRMTLGAKWSDVLGQVLRNGLSMVGLGLAIGLVGTAVLTRVLASLLYQVSALDPIALAIACALLVLVGVVAGLVPANRATKVDPVDVIRDEN
jgi:putative ABC transport system permease protein